MHWLGMHVAGRGGYGAMVAWIETEGSRLVVLMRWQ